MTLGTLHVKGYINLCKDKNGGATCDINNLPWFVIGYDFYPTSCVFSIPKPLHGG